jgi:MoxR-like ATPase
VLGTQNPIELEGTFPLPEAQLDRFLLRLKLGYPSEDEEDAILARFAADRPLDDLQPTVSAAELLELAASLERMYLDADVRRYVVRVVQATRAHPAFELGASPRASLALMRASRAWAAIQGRNYVLPDDVKHLAPHVLSHRLLLSPQARIRGRTVEAVVEESVESVPVPVEA